MKGEGSFDSPKLGRPPNDVAAIRARLKEVDTGFVSPCLLWMGALSRGQGQVRLGGRLRSVPQVMWEARYGYVPSVVKLGHLCGQGACANVRHLRPGYVAARDRHLVPALAAAIEPEEPLELRKARILAALRGWSS
jgi:hypothetical protein